MAVSVRHNNIGGSTTTKVDDATTISVEDGHLHARQRKGGAWHTVAVFAPGVWVAGEVESDSE